MQLRARILLAMLLVALLAPSAAATHMRYYAQVFTEHDDQGRSDEPDFTSTGVLGTAVVNCVIDFTPLNPGCIPDSALPGPPGGHASVVAPGCTDDSGRQTSGLCGAWTVGLYHPEINDPSLAVPPHTAGVSGMSGSAAPGRFSTDKSTPIRFLDIVQVYHGYVPGLTGSHYIDINHKLEDTGVQAALAGVDPDAGGDLLLGDVGLWAWYGTWTDRNGNGVIDHLGDVSGGTAPDNEFVWVGKCIQFDGTPAPPGQQYCHEEAAVSMPVWVWPGNHHSFCGGTLPAPATPENSCFIVSADFPGHQVVCFADVVSGGLSPVFCDGSFATFDLTDEDLYGDSLLGSQDAVWPDQAMGDRTGDINIGSRQWVYGNGWPTRFFDQSIVVTTIIMGGPTLQAFDPADRHKVPYDLGRFQSFDVDVFHTFNPLAEDLVQNQVKPMARDNWVVLRDNFIPVQNTTDGTRNNKALDTSATTAPVDDQFLNPGWSREPNTAYDAYPAAQFNVHAPSSELPAAEQLHRGWLNDYSGHADTWHGFADITETRMYHTNLVWRHPTSGNCLPQMCVSGGGIFSSNQWANALQPAGEHHRTLEPGIHVFGGFIGAWQDRAQAVRDEVVDIEGTLNGGGDIKTTITDYVVPHDGWIGNIVNTTGTWKYRGYPGPGDQGAVSCTIAGVAAERYFGECNPYWNAVTLDASPYAGPFQDTGVDIEDPQAGGGGEFVGIFPVRSVNDQVKVRIFPAGAGGDCNTVGAWTQPTLVWKNFVNWQIGKVEDIVDFTGRTGAAAVITLDLGNGGGLGANDFLVLPLGNLGTTVCSVLDEPVVVNIPERGISVEEHVRDVDVYAPWA